MRLKSKCLNFSRFILAIFTSALFIKISQIREKSAFQTQNYNECVHVQYLEDISRATFTNPSNLSSSTDLIKIAGNFLHATFVLKWAFLQV